ncbi:hypothetical protein Dvina_33710 [Dactylosporangium vinaceum]|uniref:Uncharacterized protein n=1 Tax=Dactylosporangium vinaceum TaxID=53362 RepID=A0ABV5MMJ0_9ACTN|nr:hypothetical protein [Dactylosporangium vinaceum]UAB93217.1 hypothetical protein Dvina_33710 [Dactylosporangium vinaceum]
MARAYVEYRARRRLGEALRMSAAGEHAWAIDAAKDAVELLTPTADRHPAALARALAVRAACLHVRGRREDAARDADACGRYATEALSRGSAGLDQLDDLADAAVHLPVAGRDEQAAALIDRCLELGRALPRRPAGPAVAKALRLRDAGRDEEAVELLIEAADGPWNTWQLKATTLLYAALGDTGRTDSLRRRPPGDLTHLRIAAAADPQWRIMYIAVLEVLDRHGIETGRRPPAARLARQRRVLRRRVAVRRALFNGVAALAALGRLLPADYLPDALIVGRVIAKARAAGAEAGIRRLAGVDDPRRLTRAWGALAKARWQSGGRRSDALQAQRTALAAARRWAAADPTHGTAALRRHLRRFADYATAIGLQTDAEAARAEAATLNH